jgi:hypothetical protein
MDAVTLSQVLELLKRTGKNADAAGTSTVFARLAQIAAYVDTLESTLGTVNTNVSANATKLGTNTDAAGTSTVFARLAQIAGYVDTLEGSLGQTGDAASRTGTTHAKLKDIRDFLDTVNNGAASAQKARSSKAQVFTTSTFSSWVTLCNINGKGKLRDIMIEMFDNGSAAGPYLQLEIKPTVDDTVYGQGWFTAYVTTTPKKYIILPYANARLVANVAPPPVSNGSNYLWFNTSGLNQTGGSDVNALFNLEFSSNLKLEVRVNASNGNSAIFNSLSATVFYDIED